MMTKLQRFWPLGRKCSERKTEGKLSMALITGITTRTIMKIFLIGLYRMRKNILENTCLSLRRMFKGKKSS